MKLIQETILTSLNILVLAGLIAVLYGNGFVWPELIGAELLPARAYFNDSEGRGHSAFSAGTLDLEIAAGPDFSPLITPETNASRTLTLINNEPDDMELSLAAGVQPSGELCGYLLVRAVYREQEVYNGALSALSASGLFLASSSREDLYLELILAENNHELAAQTCLFDLDFFALEYGRDSGFSDREQVQNEAKSGDWGGLAGRLLISKVFANVDAGHGRDGKHEWVELYNAGESELELKGYRLCNRKDCAVINRQALLRPGAYALLSHDAATWRYWPVPKDMLKINQLGGRFLVLDNNNEMLLLLDPEGNPVDSVNWGEPDPFWPNYHSGLWEPGAPAAGPGELLARVPAGRDTDRRDDFRLLALPTVKVLNPNGGETWWVGHMEVIEWEAANPNGPDEELLIDLYYSRDSGESWGLLAAGEANDGYHEFRLPLFLENGAYFVPAATARVKAVARGPENPLAAAMDKSDEDFCPPIDFCLLTAEEFSVALVLGLISPDHGCVWPAENGPDQSAGAGMAADDAGGGTDKEIALDTAKEAEEAADEEEMGAVRPGAESETGEPGPAELAPVEEEPGPEAL